MNLKLFNTATRQVEDFVPINKDHVLFYACGPTVYGYAHIGNFRAFALADTVARVLIHNDYNIRYIMNLTDVGHLTDDADSGDDKLEVAAEKEGKSAKEIADHYIQHFYNDYDKLNLIRPTKFTRATDYIQEQIELVRQLEIKGFTYKTSDGIYFDTSKYEGYEKLLGLDRSNYEEGTRVLFNDEKKNVHDFALWKYSPKDKKRWQEWDSPWGVGFPGWHVECSAMSMKELGGTIDIHSGGEDHLAIHHPNEIVQSECSTDQKFVNYWLHAYFMLVDGKKMSKSLNNIYTLSDLENKGYHPYSLRYFYMTAHYRTQVNFTFTALQSSQNALSKIYQIIEGYKTDDSAEIEPLYYARFLEAINDDLNMPKALAVLWDLLKDEEVAEVVKVMTVLKFDEVLGFDIESHVGFEIPEDILNLAKNRQMYRESGIYDKADALRREIEDKGYIVEDVSGGFKVKRLMK